MNDITLPERVVVHHRGWYDASINEPPRWPPPHAEYIRADVAAKQLAERDARIAELEAALLECTDDLESELDARYNNKILYPSERVRYDCDMQPVRKARELLPPPVTADTT